MFIPSSAVSNELFDFLVTSHRLGHRGFHGRDHWLRVLHNGRLLAAETGANLRVVELFALIHDSCRENESDDPLHGHRAAAYAYELRGTWFDATNAEMELLALACTLHSDGHTDGASLSRPAGMLTAWTSGVSAFTHLCVTFVPVPPGALE